MKRDMDLIRKMLLEVEESETGEVSPRLTVEGYDPQIVKYHALLLVEAGLCVGIDTTHLESVGPEGTITRLTWAGHEFLDAARNETIWQKALDRFKSTGGAITTALLTQVLAQIIKEGIGLE